MSHTGSHRRIKTRRLSQSEIRPTKVLEETGARITGVLDGHQLIGEFKGTGDKVLVGLSTALQFDPDLIFTNSEKGIAIGYIPSLVNICMIHNDGLGLRAITPFPVFKNNDIHKFDIELRLSTGRAVCKLDDNPDNTLILATKLPSISDTLNVISHGIY